MRVRQRYYATKCDLHMIDPPPNRDQDHDNFFFSAKKLGALSLSLKTNITNSKIRKNGNGRAWLTVPYQS